MCGSCSSGGLVDGRVTGSVRPGWGLAQRPQLRQREGSPSLPTRRSPVLSRSPLCLALALTSRARCGAFVPASPRPERPLSRFCLLAPLDPQVQQRCRLVAEAPPRHPPVTPPRPAPRGRSASHFSPLCPLPWSVRPGGGDLAHGLHAASPRAAGPRLALLAEGAHVPAAHQVTPSRDATQHSGDTADESLNPAREQKGLFGKMKKYIFKLHKHMMNANKVFSK